MIAHKFEQLTPEWWTARRGLPSASKFDCILTAKTLELSKTSEPYIDELIAEVMDPEYGQTEEYSSYFMKRGLAFEPESRAAYEMEANTDTEKVGLCVSDCGRYACSPDGLVGDDGLLEMKNLSAKTHVGYLRKGDKGRSAFLDDHKQQVHGQMIVTGRKWCDLFAYRPGFRSICVRAVPDAYTEALRTALAMFSKRCVEELARIRGIKESS